MSVRPSRRLLLPDRRLRLCAADAPRPERAGRSDAPRRGVRRRTAAAHRVAPSQPDGRTQRRRARSGTARPATGLRHLRTRLGRPFRRQPLRIRPQQGIAQLRTDRRTGRDRRPDGTRTDRPGRDALPADRYGRNDDARIPELVCAVQCDRMAAPGRSHRSRRTPGMARFVAPHPAHPHRRRIPSCIHPHSGTGARTGRQRPLRRSLCRAGTPPAQGTRPLEHGGALLRHGADRRTGRTGRARRRVLHALGHRRPASRNALLLLALQPRAAALRAQRPRTRLALHAAHARRCARLQIGRPHPPHFVGRHGDQPRCGQRPGRAQPVAAVDDGRHVAAAGHLRRSLRQRTPPAAAVAAQPAATGPHQCRTP